jgi:DNA invertase Pin-like site-specific DNA recombinase
VSDVKGREGDSFISPREQADRCRAAAEARGLQTGEVLEELNVSGSKMDRPALKEAIERIREGVTGGSSSLRRTYARTGRGSGVGAQHQLWDPRPA